MSDFLTAIGLVLVFEGLLYGGFPFIAKRMAWDVSQAPVELLRVAGLVAMALGVCLIWFMRGSII